MNSLSTIVGALVAGQYQRMNDEQLQQAAGLGAGVMMVMLALFIFVVVTYWKVFTKAGKPGWAAIVPIYNIIVLLEIVGRPVWWIVLMLIPFVGAVIAIIITNDLSKSFGRGIGFTIGLLLLPVVFLPILAFGDAAYQGPAAA